MARTDTRNTPTPAPTPAPAVSIDEFAIEPVEWVSTRGGVKKEPHPQLVAMLRKSWESRVVKGNSIQTPAYKLICANDEQVKLRTRQLREAGESLGIGVGIREVTASGGKTELHFRARKRRGSGAVSQVA